MRNGFLVVLAMVLLVSVVAMGCPPPPVEEELEEITFRLNWIPSSNHAIAFVAKHHGYFADEGLEVTIEVGTGSLDAVKLMEIGRVDIAIADAGVVMTGIGDGAALKIVNVVYQDSPFTFWTRKDTGIETLEDFVGRTLGGPAGDAQRVFWPALAKANNINPDAVTWVGMAPGAKIPALAATEVDIIGNFWDLFPLMVKAVGLDNLRWFRWPDYGVNNAGLAIFTSLDNIENRPEMVRSFLAAFSRAWEWALLHPREAQEILQIYAPEIIVDLAVDQFERDMELMYSPAVRTHGLGWIDSARMEDTADLVNAFMNPETPVVAAEVYTNEFLADYRWPLP